MADLGNIFSFLGRPARTPAARRKKLFGRGAVTAIDLDGQVLRVVQTVKRNGKPEVTRFAVEPLETVSAQDSATADTPSASIARALKRVKIRTGPVVMGVPRALVVLRTLHLPATDDIRELASMVHFQMAKDLPFRLEEAVLDFIIQRPTTPTPTPATAPPVPEARQELAAASEEKGRAAKEQQKLEILVAAVKKETVDGYKKTAAVGGLKLAALGLRSYANVRCVEECRVAEPDEGVVLVSLRPDEAIIDVLVNQSLVFSRGVALKRPASHEESEPSEYRAAAPDGATDATPAAPSFINAVAIEVVRSLHSYQGMKRHNPVDKVVVAGGTGEEQAVVEALQNRLKIPCSLLNPAAAFGLKTDNHQQVSGSLAAFGLSLGVNDPEGLPFDFLNPKEPAQPGTSRRTKILAGTAAGLVLFCGLLGFRHHLIKERNQLYEASAAQLAAAQKNLPTYRRMRLQAREVEKWIAQGHGWLDHYAFLSGILPPAEDLYVYSISTSSRGSIHLSVQARTSEILAQIDKKLRAAGYDVKPLAITPGPDKFGYPFKSVVELMPPDALKIDLGKIQPPERPADDASLDPAPRNRRARNTSRSQGGKS